MTTKKTKKPCCSCPDCGFSLERVGDKIVSGIKSAKAKFNKMDANTKKKVIAAAAGAGAVLVGALKVKKIVKKMKSK